MCWAYWRPLCVCARACVCSPIFLSGLVFCLIMTRVFETSCPLPLNSCPSLSFSGPLVTSNLVCRSSFSSICLRSCPPSPLSPRCMFKQLALRTGGTLSMQIQSPSSLCHPHFFVITLFTVLSKHNLVMRWPSSCRWPSTLALRRLSLSCCCLFCPIRPLASCCINYCWCPYRPKTTCMLICTLKLGNQLLCLPECPCNLPCCTVSGQHVKHVHIIMTRQVVGWSFEQVSICCIWVCNLSPHILLICTK